MPKFTIEVDLNGLPEYRKQLQRDLASSTNGPVRQMFHQWSARYRSFLQVRYSKYSRGGGDWAALKPATIRRKKSSGILIDTGTLRMALSPRFGSLPGQLEKHGPNSVVVGYGPGSHPKAKMMVDELAEIHQLGLGHMPQREIIVVPDRETLRGMQEDMERALKKLGDDTGVS